MSTTYFEKVLEAGAPLAIDCLDSDTSVVSEPDIRTLKPPAFLYNAFYYVSIMLNIYYFVYCVITIFIMLFLALSTETAFVIYWK